MRLSLVRNVILPNFKLFFIRIHYFLLHIAKIYSLAEFLHRQRFSKKNEASVCSLRSPILILPPFVHLLLFNLLFYKLVARCRKGDEVCLSFPR